MGACASKERYVTARVPELRVETGVESSAAASISGTALDAQIERSKSHWSELAEPREGLSVEEAAAIKLDNEEVFRAWRAHEKWGFFFWTLKHFKEWKVGKKFAEGAQAELFHVHVRWWDGKFNMRDFEERRTWVLKVFKKGTLLRDLQCQWPLGLFQFRAKVLKRIELGKSSQARFESAVHCAILLEDGRFAFLMEREDGDLRKLIDHKMTESGGGGPFSRIISEEIMCDVALGVDRLHRNNIIHRDLKTSNVLAYFGPRYASCVVADYECSIGVVGTGFWRAPEILLACRERNVRERPELFSKAADIYSLGMTFYEVLTGKQPFQDEEVSIDLVIEGRRPHMPEFVDEWAQQLLHRCWQSDCDMRPSIEDILGTLQANTTSQYINRRVDKRFKVLREEET